MLVSPSMKCGDLNGHATMQTDSFCIVEEGAFSPTKFSAYATPSNAEYAPEKPLILGFSSASDANGVVFISNPDKGCLCPEKITVAQVITDCDHLAATKLRAKYPREANSHKNMLSRQKSKGAVIHPDFRVFRSFLCIVDPIPAKGATLDRIDNTDLEYAPGKVRWADKHTQNNNKGDNLIFHDPITGQYHTAAQLSAKQGVTRDTIRRRRMRGWTDQAIIAGKNYIADRAVRKLAPQLDLKRSRSRPWKSPRWFNVWGRADKIAPNLPVGSR